MPAGHQDLQRSSLSSTLVKARYDPCYLGLEQTIPPQVYHKLLEVTDNPAGLCLPNRQNVILLSTSELALNFGRMIQHKMAPRRHSAADQAAPPAPPGERRHA
jgi:hypothetical protein